MVKKRSVFDINFEETDGSDAERFPAGNPELEKKSFNVQGHPLQNEAAPSRRGPMASAITEAADATSERVSAEAAIRAENDALAHEHVRLKKLGLITDLIETSSVVITKLTRDRSANTDPELQELKDSIQAIGLSNPIRVEQTGTGFELIQGYRRLAAFRELAEETGDARYTKIPAALVPRGEPLAALYRKMVDENLVRKDISFGEMAQLALSYAENEDIEPGEAVKVLYASALKQKRRYIRQFTRVLHVLGDALRYPELLPRALGIELFKLFEAEEDRGVQIAAALHAVPDRDGEAEAKILRDALAKPKEQPAPKSVSKTSLRLARPEGEARVIAQNGKVELRLPRDFSAVSREKLQDAIEAFLTSLD
ncbi:chromosome partitioning protein, ParB family [Litoreibacter ascidiaceicola]|uniref:Chromosome partitioning protein, ParB family n=1 Tax=Litoreibacter ascidiaceicola TaxID=1486859 RepID=A0A1M5BLG4_9RHOB|nr:ParB N-terminal domain-containing protein [Litoreibacter ascidiaceicola]SHF43052.1 chromosome partitioning protein, ParB family [Litoreibacter ascidiaceicola]